MKRIKPLCHIRQGFFYFSTQSSAVVYSLPSLHCLTYSPDRRQNSRNRHVTHTFSLSQLPRQASVHKHSRSISIPCDNSADTFIRLLNLHARLPVPLILRKSRETVVSQYRTYVSGGNALYASFAIQTPTRLRKTSITFFERKADRKSARSPPKKQYAPEQKRSARMRLKQNPSITTGKATRKKNGNLETRKTRNAYNKALPKPVPCGIPKRTLSLRYKSGNPQRSGS